MSTNEAVVEMLQDGCIDVRKAAELSGLSRSELYVKMSRGELVSVKQGRRRLIPRRALVAMLAAGAQPVLSATGA